MPHRDLIVVGASAGGVEALRALMASLPRDLPATVLVVLHMPAHGTSALASILSRAAMRPVAMAGQRRTLEPGAILVAPPDHHLVVRQSSVSVTRGPRVNGHRPAIDPLFLSAARWRGPRTIGVILSGTLDDGSAGLRAILRAGGHGLVQDPDEAIYGDMPMHALQEAKGSEKISLTRMGARIAELTRENVAGEPGTLTPSEDQESEQDMASSEHPATEGKPSAFSCPDCHGVLWEISDGEVVHYRCRVGHAFSAASLADGQDDALEEALWTAYRALRESASFATRLANRAHLQGLEATEKTYRGRADDAREKAEAIEKVLGRAATTSTASGDR